MATRRGIGPEGLVAMLIVGLASWVAWRKFTLRRCPDCDLQFKALELFSAVTCPGCGRVVGALEALTA